MLVLAVPVVAFSPMFAMLLGYPLPDAAWLGCSPALGTVMYVWGGSPFLTGAVSEVRSRAPGMMLLIALAITVAFLASWGASLGILDHELDFWWELALLIVIMLLGHWIEMRSLAQTTSALDSLAALLPDEAERVEGDSTVSVSPSELRIDDVVVVRPGARVPADGQIVQGSASMDESMITGESRPVRRAEGDAVVAGTVATDSGVRVRITAVGDDTALAGIQKLVSDAQNSSSRAPQPHAAARCFCRRSRPPSCTAWPHSACREWWCARAPSCSCVASRLGLAIPGGVHRDGAGRAGRCAREGPSRAREHAGRRHRAFRQDGNAHRGRPPWTAVAPTSDADAAARVARACRRGGSASPAPGDRRARRAHGAARDAPRSPLGVRARVEGRVVEVGGRTLLEETGVGDATRAR